MVQFFGSQTVTGDNTSDELVYGAHLQAWMIFEYDFTGEYESENPDDLIATNFKWLADNGYNHLLLDAMDPEEGTYFFECELLKKNEYTPGTVIFDAVMREAKKRDISVFADLTVLAWRLDDYLTEIHSIGGTPLSTAEVANVCETLINKYGVDGIVAETFPTEYASSIHQVTQKFGARYIHKFDNQNGDCDILMSEDYVGFASTAKEIEALEETGAEANNIGLFSALFGHAEILDIPGWVKVGGKYGLPDGAEKNVMLFRAVQFGCDGYFWMSADGEEGLAEFKEFDVSEIKKWINLFRENTEKKPVANCIIAFTPDTEEGEGFLLLDHGFGPVSNALNLAGYSIRTTYNEVMEDADFYVVFALGQDIEEEIALEFPNDVMNVFDKEKPIWIVPQGIGTGDNWKEILKHVGVNPNKSYSTLTNRINEVEYCGYETPWNCFTIWEYPNVTTGISVNDVDGETLISTNIAGEKIALVTKNNDNYLINSNTPHLLTTYAFHTMISCDLTEPFFGYGITGKKSAFFALEDTNLSVRLPFEAGENISIFEFDSDGNHSKTTNINYEGEFKTKLKKHELVIITKS